MYFDSHSDISRLDEYYEFGGLGFDFVDMIDYGASYGDNGGYTSGLRNCTEVPNLFSIFDEMGMSAEDKEKIARGNFHRVIRQVLR